MNSLKPFGFYHRDIETQGTKKGRKFFAAKRQASFFSLILSPCLCVSVVEIAFGRLAGD